MARTQQVTFRVQLWRDPSWTALPCTAQWLYFTIAASSTIDSAGICPLLMRQWAGRATDLAEGQVRAALDSLVAGGFAVVDEDREEVLLPRLLADRGAENQPNVIKGAIRAARAASRPLRERFAQVIADMEQANPNLLVATGIARSSRRPILPSVRLAVYERDNWCCQDCGRRIPPNTGEERRGLNAPSDESGWLELDHIHPWSEGGEDVEGNLRALCSRCNRVKGCRLLLEVDEKARV